MIQTVVFEEPGNLPKTSMERKVLRHRTVMCPLNGIETDLSIGSCWSEYAT